MTEDRNNPAGEWRGNLPGDRPRDDQKSQVIEDPEKTKDIEKGKEEGEQPL
jgi:hypothetical protein